MNKLPLSSWGARWAVAMAIAVCSAVGSAAAAVAQALTFAAFTAAGDRPLPRAAALSGTATFQALDPELRRQVFRQGLKQLPQQQGGPGNAAAMRAALALAGSAAAVAAVRGLVVRVSRTGPARGGRIAMLFRKRYGGGQHKRDWAAVYGPQYHGPKLDYGIQRSGRLGMPKSGDQRVIPKLSGGSYEARRTMMRNLTTELIRHGRIKTTFARATALRSFVDRMVVLAKRGDDLSMREASEWMFDEKLVENLFKLAPERYSDQGVDFTKVTRTMNRKGDWAEMAYIELV